MQPWLYAWILGTISGLSLPIGAILGIAFSPVRDQVCAGWMALGAGALLFAVTVELYGHALRELELGRAGLLELLVTVVGALCGAFFYLAVNRWLERMVEDGFEETEKEDEESPFNAYTEKTPLMLPPPKHRKDISVGSALAEERRIWEQVYSPRGTPHGSECVDLFRNASFTRDGSFTGSDDLALKARGRDKVINRISAASSQRISTGSSQRPKSLMTPQSPGESVAEVDPRMAQRGKQVAFALFLGLLVDGVPEGLLMGFLAAEGHLSIVLVISLLVANFPEAFSSASLMRQGGVSTPRIIGMWGGLCLMVGALAGSACFLIKHFFPSYPHGGHLPQMLLLLVAAVEGITGGAMIACIATVMLPEAFNRAGRDVPLVFTSGFLCTAGFLVAVTMKACEHHYNNTHDEPDMMGHAFFGPGAWLF